MKISLFFVGFCLIYGNCLELKEIVIIILSQSNNYHSFIAENLKRNIIEQAKSVGEDAPIVHLTHSDFSHVGSWAILPLIPYIRNFHRGNCSWFFFMEDKTRIRLRALLEVLNAYDSNQEIWLGHAIRDKEATIIHHFQFFENPGHFKYPIAASGMAITSALMKRLADRWKKRETSSSDFNIDYAYELALFIWNNKKGPELVHEPLFCTSDNNNCATYSIPFKPCNTPILNSAIYFAVKTCKKFHDDRVPVVQKTWGQYAKTITYFSDVEDNVIPTVKLGIPNTEQGHCAKTFAILQHVDNQIAKRPYIKWVVIADDDTIFSIVRLQQFLSCYDESEEIVLGERYGFNIYSEEGYNYITGGGGIIFSRSLLRKIVNSNMCKCPSKSSPDDMFLGVCFRRLKVNVTHSPLFHQARPVDYASEYLSNENVISFHKHWMIDPLAVYRQWFQQEDMKIASFVHEEL